MNVFDFDETIYDGESSVEFILNFLKVDPSIVKYMPKVAKAVWLYEREQITVDDFINDYAYILVDYCQHKSFDMDKIVSDFWDKRMHKVKRWYKKIQRSDDIIVTASPSFYMDEICRRLGIKHMLCTDFDFSTGKLNRACYREEKVPMFLEKYPDAVIDNFYTDSMNDKFLFPYAKKVFIVKKNEITEYNGAEVGSALRKD